MTSATAALHTENLTKHYGSVVGLDSLNLDVQQGEVLGYLGPNGAGKTTTIRSILGLIRPTSGSAEIFVSTHRNRRWSRTSGWRMFPVRRASGRASPGWRLCICSARSTAASTSRFVTS